MSLINLNSYKQVIVLLYFYLLLLLYFIRLILYCFGLVLIWKAQPKLCPKDALSSIKSCSLGSEFGELGEEANGLSGISGVFAEHISVSELKTEEVSGGHGVSSPGTGSDETIPSILDGFTELFWEHGGVGLLNNGEGEKGDVDELRGEGDVAVHGAFKFRHDDSKYNK